MPHQAVAHGRGEQLLHQHVQVLGGAERTAFGGVAHLEHADGLARGLAARHGDVAQVDPHRAPTPLLESVHRAWSEG